ASVRDGRDARKDQGSVGIRLDRGDLESRRIRLRGKREHGPRQKVKQHARLDTATDESVMAFNHEKHEAIEGHEQDLKDSS
ncbi:MAG: hypothetical protein ACRD3G_22560, partial [Vicinamibacterales bacterium]